MKKTNKISIIFIKNSNLFLNFLYYFIFITKFIFKNIFNEIKLFSIKLKKDNIYYYDENENYFKTFYTNLFSYFY
jgi:hypothetical protein